MKIVKKYSLEALKLLNCHKVISRLGIRSDMKLSHSQRREMVIGW
jgi:hypothetical protein